VVQNIGLKGIAEIVIDVDAREIRIQGGGQACRAFPDQICRGEDLDIARNFVDVDLGAGHRCRRYLNFLELRTGRIIGASDATERERQRKTRQHRGGIESFHWQTSRESFMFTAVSTNARCRTRGGRPE
jgi:hypothetical protein